MKNNTTKFLKPALILLTLAVMVSISSCSKTSKSKWDDDLNGTWVEIDKETGADLNYTENLVFNDNYMNIDGYTVTSTFSDDNLVYADDNQIYGSWKILIRKHIDYLYDYKIVAGQLWLVPDYSASSAPDISALSDSRKFRRK